jgi:hypothetical protein
MKFDNKINYKKRNGKNKKLQIVIIQRVYLLVLYVAINLYLLCLSLWINESD